MSIISIGQGQEIKQAVLPWSSHQHEIFRNITEGTDNLLIGAVAGSGKTTTIVHALSLLPKGKRVLFVAFNRNVVKQLEQVCPPTVTVKTLHGMGTMILRQNRPRLRIKGSKVMDLLKYTVLDCNKDPVARDWCYEHSFEIGRMISLLKSCMITMLSPEAIKEMIVGRECSLPIDDNSLAIYARLLELSYEYDGVNHSTVDFDDMVCLPNMLPEIVFPKYDYVFIDEAQDINFAQRDLIRNLVGVNGRLIAVGDKHQAIYGFRGADFDSMDRFRDTFNCRELSLPVCYRCDRAIVDQARKLQPSIESKPYAKPGSVRTIGESEINDYAQIGDLVLCRTNAPLMKTAIALITGGSNVCLLGRDLMTPLVKIVNAVARMNGSISARYIQDYLILQEIALQDRKWQLGKMEDNCSALMYVVGTEVTSKEQMIKALETVIYKELPEHPVITLSTIHGAKGSESSRVFIIAPEQLPHRLAEGDSELQQEDNLHYVAITRAKNELFYVTTES